MSKKENQNSTKGQNRIFPLRLIFIVISIGIILFMFLSKNLYIKEISWMKFKSEMLLSNDVEKLDVVNNEIVEVYIKQSSLKKKKFSNLKNKGFGYGPHYTFTIGSVDVFHEQLKEAQLNSPDKHRVEVTYSKRINWWNNIISWSIPLGLLMIFWLFISRKIATGIAGGQSIYSFGKSKARMKQNGNSGEITFKNVAGLEEVKKELIEIVKFLKTPNKFRRLGAKIPKGILLVGPPGSGKTLLAKAVAGEADVPFFSLSGSEFIEMFVGVGAARMRDLFKQAKEKAPSIIFIDEIDTIGRSRSNSQIFQRNEERESTLNQLLAELDGFNPNTGVIVLAATNRGDILDSALLRPGRFDRHIHLELPTLIEREAIFEVHMRPLILNSNTDAKELAKQTPGFSGADIANICNEAALNAAMEEKESVDKIDFSNAIDRVVGGLERKSKILKGKEKTLVAYHEAGHVIVSWFLKNTNTLQKVSIIPRGRSLGSAWFLPEEKQIFTKTFFQNTICIALGGRAAEKLMLDEISSNALDDIEKATKQAYAMVVNYGFSPNLPNISYYDSTGKLEQSFQKPFSEKTAEIIDFEIQKIINEAYSKAIKILKEHRIQLDLLAKELIVKEVLQREDIVRILGKVDSI